MPKLTLSFKGHVIDVYHLEQEETCIGRDESCDISIDSLAVAPQQALIRQSNDQEYQLEAMDEDFPVMLNHEKIEVSSLSHGDVIQVGKHTLSYSDDVLAVSTDLGASSSTDEDKAEDEDATDEQLVDSAAPSGMLQIMNGANFGRIIPLTRHMTRIGQAGGDCAMISKRDEGYYLSLLEGQNPPRVNKISIGNGTHRLNDGDIVEVGGIKMQFHS